MLAATIGVAVGLGLALLRTSHATAPETFTLLQAHVTWPAGERVAPPIRLRDEEGTTLSLGSLRGHVVLLTFLDSRCRGACQTEGRMLGDVQRRTAGLGAVLLVVSVDPWADTAANAHSFASRSHWSGSWFWLSGRKGQLAPVWSAYDIAVKRTPGGILNDMATYVIDKRGDVRGAYLYPFSADVLAGALRRLDSSS